MQFAKNYYWRKVGKEQVEEDNDTQTSKYNINKSTGMKTTA